VGVVTSKIAVWMYSIIAGVFVILGGVVQMGGVYGIRRKGREYIPPADYY